MSTISRRAFLAGTGSIPFVYGLLDLETQESKDAEPAWFKAALARMNETGRWGLGIVIPSGDQRYLWGRGLWTLTAFPDDDTDAHEIFCESVVMAVTAEFAARRFGFKEKCDRFLLAPDGTLLASEVMDLKIIEDSRSFAASFRKFIHGADNKELRNRAKAIEASLSDELKRAAEGLGSDSIEERSAAAAAFARKAESLTPYLAWLEHGEGNDRRRRPARNLLSSYFASLKAGDPGSKLPYGCTGPHYSDPCPSCGLGRIPERSRNFLKFLVPGEPPSKKELED